jgi:Raf kinase inhibitor-like YbhB/YbcL family protein
MSTLAIRPLSVALIAICAIGCTGEDATEATESNDAAMGDADAGSGVMEDGGPGPDGSTSMDAARVADTGRDAVVDAASRPADAHLPMDAASESFRVTSTAFDDGDPIPPRHTCFGEDLQPALSWFDAPPRTKSFAVVLIDESFDFVHYIAHDIPFDVTTLPEGASDDGTLPDPSREVEAYGGGPFHGPCPPAGPNTYAFRVYALDRREVEFAGMGNLNNADLESAFGPHQLGLAVMRGTAVRP